MAISQPRERLMTLTAVAAGVSTFANYEPHPAAIAVSVFAIADTAGTLNVSRVGTDGTQTLISAVAVAADTLSVTTLDYNPGPLFFQFSPTTGPSTGSVEATYYGHAGGLS